MLVFSRKEENMKMLFVTLVLLTSCLGSKDKEAANLTPEQRYIKKCFEVNNNYDKNIKAFGYDPENITEEQQAYVDRYFELYCECDVKNFKAAGHLTEENLSKDKERFSRFLGLYASTTTGQESFKECYEYTRAPLKEEFPKKP